MVPSGELSSTTRISPLIAFREKTASTFSIIVPMLNSSLNVGIITVRSYMKKHALRGREEIDPGILACKTGVILEPRKCVTIRVCSTDILCHDKIHRTIALQGIDLFKILAGGGPVFTRVALC